MSPRTSWNQMSTFQGSYPGTLKPNLSSLALSMYVLMLALDPEITPPASPKNAECYTYLLSR